MVGFSFLDRVQCYIIGGGGVEIVDKLPFQSVKRGVFWVYREVIYSEKE